jgi:hypothetical protein
LEGSKGSQKGQSEEHSKNVVPEEVGAQSVPTRSSGVRTVPQNVLAPRQGDSSFLLTDQLVSYQPRGGGGLISIQHHQQWAFYGEEYSSEMSVTQPSLGDGCT